LVTSGGEAVSLPTNLQLLAMIALITWALLILVALIRLRSVPIESKTNEMPKLMILASSVAGAVTLTASVVAGIFFPQFLQENSASLYTAGFLGAAILLWWTAAVFWRETKLISAQAPQRSAAEIAPKKSFEPVVVRPPTSTLRGHISPSALSILKTLRGGKMLSAREIMLAADLSYPTCLDMLTRLVEYGLVAQTTWEGKKGYILARSGKAVVDSS